MGRARRRFYPTTHRRPPHLRLDEPELQRLLDLSGVDQLFEPAADLLACREEIVVAPPAGREVHDADTLIALTVAAGVSGRLIERPEAVTGTPQPRHVRTPTMRPRL